MLKPALVLILFMLSTKSFGQYRLFIKPIYHMKNSFARLSREHNVNETFPFQNKGFFMPYSNAFTSPFVTHPTFDIGFALGGISENKRHLFEMEWSKDHCGYRTRSYFNDYQDPNSTSLDFYWYPNLSRYSLNYSYGMVLKKNYALRLTTGVGVFRNSNNNLSRSAEQFYSGVFVAPNVEITAAYIQPFPENKTTLNVKIGLQNDFYIKTKYIASLSVQYIQGFGRISFVEYSQEYLNNGIPNKTSVGLFSRGSGIYFELSRRIQVYALKDKKRGW